MKYFSSPTERLKISTFMKQSPSINTLKHIFPMVVQNIQRNKCCDDYSNCPDPIIFFRFAISIADIAAS